MRSSLIALAMLGTMTAMAQTWTNADTAPQGVPAVAIPIAHGMLNAIVDGERVTLAFGNGEVQTETSFAAKNDADVARGLIKAMDRSFPEPTRMRAHHRIFTGPPMPGGVSLPVGYTNVPERGIDTVVGHVDGLPALSWRYDVGKLAGNAAKGDASWAVDGKVRGSKVSIATKRDGTLVVHFEDGDANFFASPHSRKELVIVLASVLTYSVAH